ncbi:MAG: type II toxin-antitoxin system HicB family antitoxin [Planctomycetota bacterium]
MSYKYEILIYWSDDDQAFVAELPELAGCAAHGDSPGAALANCQEAIGLWIETARDQGRAIPEPKGRRLRLA